MNTVRRLVTFTTLSFVLACGSAAPRRGADLGTGGDSDGDGGAGGVAGAPSDSGGRGGAGGGAGTAGAGTGGRGAGGSGGQAGTGGSMMPAGGTGGSSDQVDSGAAGPDADVPVDAGAGGAGPADAAGHADVAAGGAGGGDSSALTVGWREVPFTFAIHKPYDLPESARHSFDPATNTHTFWVLSTDKPHDPPPNMTAPRTELRMNNDYTTGMHQFEADFYVVNGTEGPCVMQVFGGSAHATAFMLKAYGGALKHYDRELVLSNAYEKWLHLNVIHNADTGEVKAYIDGKLVGTFKDNGPATHYFKCGVYGPSSGRSETRFRNIKNWVK